MKRILISILVMVSISACSSDANTQDLQTDNNPLTTGNVLTLRLQNISPMTGQHYEGWLLIGGKVISSGRFSVNEDNDIYQVDASGTKVTKIGTNNIANFTFSENISNSSDFILTIEPNNDSDPAPSSIHYVAGEFIRGVATAITSDGGAIGASFVDSAGSFILATPTNGSSTHNQGIWFLDNGSPSLDLPVLNNGWVYEGWVVNTMTGEVASTGTFLGASGADRDGAGATAGAGGFPPFPGQDFINPAKLLNDGNYRTVISIEPSEDFDPSPFTLKILASDIEKDASVMTGFLLNNISNEDSISITATLQ